jgi:hypothetical protein
MARNTAKQLEQENAELVETLDSINDVAREADDAGLTREEIIQKVREIAELSETEEAEEGNGEGEED